MQWVVPEGNFWDDETLQRRRPSPDRWVSLMRMHGGAQAEMIAGAPEECRELFGKRIKLMRAAKGPKSALKAENAVDFSGLIHQAMVILEKGVLSARGSIFWSMNFRIFPATGGAVRGATQAE